MPGHVVLIKWVLQQDIDSVNRNFLHIVVIVDCGLALDAWPKSGMGRGQCGGRPPALLAVIVTPHLVLLCF
jgi:hypothetical protein